MATVQQFYNILEQSESLGISKEELSKLKSIRAIKNVGRRWPRRNAGIFISGIAILMFVVCPSVLVHSILNKTSLGNFILKTFDDSFVIQQNVENTPCIIRSQVLGPYARVPTDCSKCIGVTEVIQVRNLSQNDFVQKYAFTMQPIVVRDGQANWTARDTFSYEYFQSIYSPGSRILEEVSHRCQFFPYQTEMSGLKEFFNMSKGRLEGKAGPWYVGWINCEGQAANELRKHYRLPYFLSPELDHSKLDWVFMGMPGHGAPMHVDFVQSSTWQAQLRGQKKWTFESPPECYGTCIRRLEVTANPGDIIVFDGNRWFHQTEIIGNDISIVIGSEYY